MVSVAAVAVVKVVEGLPVAVVQVELPVAAAVLFLCLESLVRIICPRAS